MGEPKLEHVRTFLAVYRTGSFTGAARELGISQPTATAHVAALERELGSALFDRGPGRLTPNARADSLAANVAAHLDGVERALWSLRPGNQGYERSIQLAGPADYLATRVLPYASDWLPDDVSLHVRFGLAKQLLVELEAGTHDVILSSVPVRGPGLRVAPLYDEEFALVGAPRWSYLVESLAAAGPGDVLGPVPILGYDEYLPIIRRYWRSVWDQRPNDLNVVSTIPDLRAIAAMVTAGVGISVLPTYVIEEQLREGALIELDSPPLRPLNTVMLVARAQTLERDPVLAGLWDSLLDHERRT